MDYRHPTIPASPKSDAGYLLSARWAGPEKDFAAAMARVLTEMGDTPDRRAWFVCALSLAWPDGETATYLGRVDGTVLPAPRGNRGFGYDPLFLPTSAVLGYGEMEPAKKHTGSHRARAMAQFVAACIQR